MEQEHEKDEKNKQRIPKSLLFLALWNTFLSIFLIILVYFFFTKGALNTLPVVQSPYDNSNIDITNIYCSTFDELCSVGSNITIRATGTSMMPTLNDGAFYSCTRQNSYDLGDIITFYKNTKLISHRIVGISDRYYTKGDNTALYKDITQDPWAVFSNEILCKITGFAPPA
jgi:hypothetical protein